MTIAAQIVARILMLPILMVSLAIIVKGYSDIGDGFSAGVIASLGFILQAIAFGPAEFARLPYARYASLAAFGGLLLALGVAFGPVLAGDSIFVHRPGPGEPVVHFGTLEFFTPLLFDIGVFVIVLGFCIGSLGAIGQETSRRAQEDERRRTLPDGAGGGE